MYVWGHFKHAAKEYVTGKYKQYPLVLPYQSFSQAADACAPLSPAL